MKEIKFKKWKILSGVIFFVFMLTVSISFLLTPDRFIRNAFMTAEHIQTIGIMGLVYFSTLLFSLVKLLTRKYAILITDEFLVDNSRYESLGKIRWADISNIQRLQKRSIELNLNQGMLKTSNRNLLKRFLNFMHNWKYNKSIVISSALLECGINELYEVISEAHKESLKLKTTPNSKHKI